LSWLQFLNKGEKRIKKIQRQYPWIYTAVSCPCRKEITPIRRGKERAAIKRGEEITHIKRERDNSMERERDNYFSELNKTYRYN
jgi:hypothetical protein